MDAETCIKKLGYVGILTFATVDKHGHPQARSISAIHYEPDAIYFYTARGKNFCQQLMDDGHVQIHALTKFKEMIRLSAVAKPVPDDEQEHWKNVIFEEQPYLVNVYPGDTKGGSASPTTAFSGAPVRLTVRKPVSTRANPIASSPSTACTVATASRTVLRKRLSVLKIKS